MKIKYSLLLLLFTLSCSKGPLYLALHDEAVDKLIYPTVKSVNPANSKDNIMLDTKIDIEFSQAMMLESISSSNAKTDCTSSISLSASSNDFSTCLAKSLITVNENKTRFTFSLADNLSYNTKYTIRINTNVKAGNGISLKQDYLSSFTTENPFRVISISPSDEDSNVSVSSKILISFSENALLSSLSVQDSDGTCTGSIQLSFNDFATCVGASLITSNNPVVEITPKNDLYACKTYKLKLNANISSADTTKLLSSIYEMDTGFTSMGDSNWTEFNNPIIGKNVADKAYYPSVLKIDNEYYMWVGDGSQTRFVKSFYPDFKDKSYADLQILTGDIADNIAYPFTYHPHVLYKSDGWKIMGGTYTQSFLMYITPNFDAVYIFLSSDGIDWTLLDQIENVTNKPNGAGSGYQATNAYTFNVVYENDTTWKAYSEDGGGTIHYYTSSDGFLWTGVQHQVLGAYDMWESFNSRLSQFTLKYNNEYLIFYSSGTASNDNAIGMGVSTDGGKTFSGDSSNPIYSITDSVSWRDSRTYTPRLVRDDNANSENWLMYFTGKSSSDGNYAVGLAAKCGALK